MLMVAKPIRVMAYHKELPAINFHDLLIHDHVRSRDRLNTLYLHLQKTCGYQTRQGAD